MIKWIASWIVSLLLSNLMENIGLEILDYGGYGERLASFARVFPA
jgi:hypothetical protein